MKPFDVVGLGKSVVDIVHLLDHFPAKEQVQRAIAVTVHFFGGWLSDFTRLKYFLWLNILGMLVAGLGVFTLTTPLGIYLIIIGRGVYGGTYSLLASVTWPRFFGRKHLGAISGYNMSHMVLGSGIGPFIFGWSFDYTGDYLAGVFACAVVLVGLLVFSLKADNPQHALRQMKQSNR